MILANVVVAAGKVPEFKHPNKRPNPLCFRMES
jgi:hypothetical protein